MDREMSGNRSPGALSKTYCGGPQGVAPGELPLAARPEASSQRARRSELESIAARAGQDHESHQPKLEAWLLSGVCVVGNSMSDVAPQPHDRRPEAHGLQHSHASGNHNHNV